MTLSLSPAEARKIVLLSQGVLSSSRKGRAIDATLQAVEHLGYIQIDTISVIARAHHHTLWNRCQRYQPNHLEKLVAQRSVFEYWSHAAAYLPMRSYRFSLPRMQQEARNTGHWHEKNPRLMRQVLKRIEAEGPLMARDFADPNPGNKAMWQWKPAKYALEQLFMEGRIMATRRQGFNKVYDLTERVLPDTVDRSMPEQEEYARFLVYSFLKAHGLGQLPEFYHLRKAMGPAVRQAVNDMLEQGELLEVKVGKTTWLMLPGAADCLRQSLARARLKLLSPFDNLVILRKRIMQLFDFDYQIECYLPADKRRFGYFSLPVLWQGKLVARADCKAHRDQGVLELRNLVVEASVKNPQAMLDPLAAELSAFASFNQCNSISVGQVSDKKLGRLLKQRVAD